ncbi:MAG: tetratricopeptide repeat protein [Deltaproteobacteria bacterium]|nr:tetratricopeptide repeat protein [Deltaproteobacteria bacterium]
MTALTACSDPTPTVEGIRAQLAENRVEEALDGLREMIDSGDRDPEVLYLYGQALLNAGEWSRSIWALEEARRDPDWNERATLQLARVAYRASNFDLAIEYLDDLLEKNPENVDGLRIRCLARLQSRRDYAGALGDAETALDLEPDSAEMQAARIVALLGLGLHEEAGEVLEELAAAGIEEGLEGETGDSSLAGDLGATSNQNAPLMCVAHAKYVEESGDLERAGDLYDECFERYPTSVLVINDAIGFHGEAGSHDRVDEILRGAYEAAPEERAFRIALARRLQILGRPDEAREILEEADEAGYAGAWRDLAGFLIDEGDLEGGIEIFAKAHENGVSNLDFLITYTEALLSAERLDDAEAIANEVESKSHKGYLLGRIALKRDRPEEALEQFGAAILLWPDNGVLRYYAAIAAEQIGDFDRAVEEFRAVMRIDAGAADARIRLARIHFAEGNIEAALYVLRFRSIDDAPIRNTDELVLLELEAVARGGRNAPPDLIDRMRDPAIWGRAVAALARGTRQRAGAEASRAIVEGADRLDLTAPLSSPALRELVHDLAETDALDEALERAQQGLDRNPSSVEHRVIHAEALERADRLDESARSFERALELTPTHARALHGRGRVAMAQGKREEALAYLERIALDDEANDESVVSGVRAHAELLIALGRTEEAEARLRALLDVAPVDGQAALRLAELELERKGDTGAARRWAKQSLRFGGGEPAAALLERLASG